VLVPLEIRAGALARETLAREGWHGDAFRYLVGASGGPKWLVLSRLDRVLFTELLLPRTQPLLTLGSSIGAWRNSCLALPDPGAAIERMEQAYLAQRYGCDRPSPDEVSQVGLAMLETVLGAEGAEHLTAHPLIGTHIVTARADDQARSSSLAGLGQAALRNALQRSQLGRHFQRVVFHSQAAAHERIALRGFATHYAPLLPSNLRQALHASGSIPMVLAGERDINHAPPGHYWDGGIIDYHFDPEDLAGLPGLVLYPHFVPHWIPGWFDKFLPWRKRERLPDNVVLISPSAAFVRSLPLAKIPDRSDFRRCEEAERQHNWGQVLARTKELADAMRWQLQQSDPLAGVQSD
jgi:hypothetical protein